MNEKSSTSQTSPILKSVTNEPATTAQLDESIQLEEYLNKFIHLVPHLKQIDQEEKIKKILFSSQILNEQQQLSYAQQIESLQNLDINSKSISDLQILQSVLDYIVDLQNKVISNQHST